jgi:hypothetical protein
LIPPESAGIPEFQSIPADSSGIPGGIISIAYIYIITTGMYALNYV